MRLSSMIAASGLLLCSLTANSTVVTLDGPPANDVDNLTPTLVTVSTPLSGIITDLNFYIDIQGIQYDNTVILSHIDSGTDVTIWFDGDTFGASWGSVFDTTFDDEATESFEDQVVNNATVPAGGTWIPMESLSAFDGENILGTWQLSIQNTGCCAGEGDDLLGWSIIAEIDGAESVPVPAPLALIGLGLLGLRMRQNRKQI